MPILPTTEEDPRAAVRTLVDELQPHDAVEAEHRAATLAWIDTGVPIFRTAKPATPPMHLVSYCLVVDTAARLALLVDHRDAGRWLPTGGHVEPGEHPMVTAEREVEEELGTRLGFHPAVGKWPLLVTVTETEGRSTRHTDVSLWFLFAATPSTPIRPDPGEFAGARWWDFDEVGPQAEVAFDPHLPRCLAKLDRLLVDQRCPIGH